MKCSDSKYIHEFSFKLYFNVSIFKVSKRDVMNKTVVFQVIDWDRMKKDEGIGEVRS